MAMLRSTGLAAGEYGFERLMVPVQQTVATVVHTIRGDSGGSLYKGGSTEAPETPVVAYDMAMMAWLDKEFTHYDSIESIEYFAEHSQVLMVMPKVLEAIRQHFPNAPLMLKKSSYLDVVFVYILTDLDYDEAKTRFDLLDEGWYARQNRWLTVCLNIDIKFV